MWSVLEPGREFKRGWVLGAMCEVMEAVHLGQLRDVIMNVPPGMGKSHLLAAFTAWEWGPRGMPHLRYVTVSYAHNLTRRDNRRVRSIVRSDAYQAAWGSGALEDGSRRAPDAVAADPRPPACLLTRGQQSVDLVATTGTGFRLASSIGGQVMGERGDRTFLDDPNRTDRTDSLAELNAALQFVTETLPTRQNDADKSVEVLIQQRTHVLDVTGHKLRHGLYDVHLCLPMEYDPARACSVPSIGFSDPRREPGELLFPERFPQREVEKLKTTLRSWGGNFAVSGQFEQRPVPRGGGMLKRSWFKVADSWEIPQGGRAVRGWDLAASDAPGSAYTAGVRLRRHPSGLIVVESALQRQLTPGLREAWMREVALGDGPGVQQDYPQDPGQAGKTQKAALASGAFEGMDARSDVESGSKASRLLPFAVQAENGNVVLVRADWNEDFLSQAENFLKGARSDIMDGTSRAYANLLRNAPPPPPAGPELVTTEASAR
jgi:predicted phage terminase large subunit-like protein